MIRFIHYSLIVYSLLLVFHCTKKKTLHSLDIDSSPSGAKVFLNNKYIGSTPVISKLHSGTYEIRLNKEKHYPILKTLEVVEDHALILELEKKTGSLKVNANLEPDLLYIGEHKITGKKSITLAGGEYQLLAFKEGFPFIHQSVIIREDREYIENIYFTKVRNPAKLALETIPANVIVKLNGITIGKTPLVLNELAAKDYPLSFHLSGYSDHHHLFQLKEKQIRKVSLKMVPTSVQINFQGLKRTSKVQISRLDQDKVVPIQMISMEEQDKLFLSQGNYLFRVETEHHHTLEKTLSISNKTPQVLSFNLKPKRILDFNQKLGEGENEFKEITGLVNWKNNLAVLDSGRSKLIILDPQGKALSEINFASMKIRLDVLGRSASKLLICDRSIAYVCDFEQGKLVPFLGSYGEKRLQFRRIRSIAYKEESIFISDTLNEKVSIHNLKSKKTLEIKHQKIIGADGLNPMSIYYANGSLWVLDNRDLTLKKLDLDLDQSVPTLVTSTTVSLKGETLPSSPQDILVMDGVIYVTDKKTPGIYLFDDFGKLLEKRVFKNGLDFRYPTLIGDKMYFVNRNKEIWEFRTRLKGPSSG